MKNNNEDYKEILNVLQVYIDGCAGPNADKLRLVFHPQAQLFGIMDGKTIVFQIEAWFVRVMGNPKPANDAKIGPPPVTGKYWKVSSVNIVDDIATAIVISQYMGVWFTDFMSLLRCEDGWKIVNKIFSYERLTPLL